MIYHRGGEPERAMHCCSMSVPQRGKQYFVQPFFSVNEATKATHTLLLNFTLKLWAEFLTLVSVDYSLDLPEANSTVRDLSLSVSSLPLSVMVRSCHACVVFVPHVSFTATLRSGSGPSPTRQLGISHARNYLRTFGHEIFKCVHLNLRYMAANV